MRSLLPIFTLFVLATPPAQAQVGAMYRCSAVEYTNMLSASEAQARQCAKIGSAEWVAVASDAAGNKYEYHDRRTVYRGNGSVETWLQVVRSALPRNDLASSPFADALLAKATTLSATLAQHNLTLTVPAPVKAPEAAPAGKRASGTAR